MKIKQQQRPLPFVATLVTVIAIGACLPYLDIRLHPGVSVHIQQFIVWKPLDVEIVGVSIIIPALLWGGYFWSLHRSFQPKRSDHKPREYTDQAAWPPPPMRK